MEKSINRIYSEFTYHFDDVYQRSVQFYVWCLSRAGMFSFSSANYMQISM